LDEIMLELFREFIEGFAWIFAQYHHLSKMRFRVDMALETILIAALLLASLAIPSQPLQAFRFELVAEMFRGANLGFRHCGGLSSKVMLDIASANTSMLMCCRCRTRCPMRAESDLTRSVVCV